MSATTRKFPPSEPAVRSAVPLLVGLVGPSGSGKTYTALRLATGMQRITGGKIHVIDTEARRAAHYADKFRFQHVPFAAPFSPLDYLAAIEHCVAEGSKVIVVDSMSHEHEGPGGVLEEHAAEVERLSTLWKSTPDKVLMSAWAAPKAKRRRLLNSVVQLGVYVIFCFRAKEKIKPQAGKPPLELGWMPIAGEEFVYELTLGMLLLPGSGGVPTWAPQHVGEKSIIKLPEQFAPLFAQGSPLAVCAPNSPLSESHGEALARWSAGEPSAATQTALDPVVANWQTVLEALPTAGEEQVVALNTLSRSVAAAVASGELAEPRLQAVRSLFAGYANAHGLKGGKGGYVRSSR